MVLAALFGIYVIIEGVFVVIAAFNNRKVRSWWVLSVEGLAGIVVGCVAWIWLVLTAVVFLFFIAIWAISAGLLEIGAAIQLRKEIRGEWILALTGVLSILIGLILFIEPLGAKLLHVIKIGTVSPTTIIWHLVPGVFPYPGADAIEGRVRHVNTKRMNHVRTSMSKYKISQLAPNFKYVDEFPSQVKVQLPSLVAVKSSKLLIDSFFFIYLNHQYVLWFGDRVTVLF
jgi:hypothetical protein